MDILKSVTNVFQKTPPLEKEYYVALALEESYIGACVWYVDDAHRPVIVGKAVERAPSFTWSDRIHATDMLLGRIEEQLEKVTVKNVIFGLGERFLTKDGDIKSEVRKELKKFTTELSLHPLGFVSILTGIAHFLKRKEGVPTSVILIGVSEAFFDIAMYRVGRLSFHTTVERTDSCGEDVENALKSASDAEVFPSHILLFGADDVQVEDIKAHLLRHQWTAKANFLHYPKIDRFVTDDISEAIAEAGASELTHTYGDDKEEVIEETSSETPPLEEDVSLEAKEEKQKEEEYIGDPKETHMVVVQPESLGFHEQQEKEKELTFTELMANTKDVTPAPFRQEEPPVQDDEEMVGGGDEEQDEEQEKERRESSFDTPSPFVRVLKNMWGGIHLGTGRIPTFRIPGKIPMVIILGLIVLGVGYYALTQLLPRVAITLYVLPKTVSHDDTIVIDPTATSVDTTKKIVPGGKIEKIVSGEKSVATTGKKKIGDPAKGVVTIFNKSETASHTLKKGTVCSTGGVQFSLDTDVTVASATTNLSESATVFGKATANVTAASVGTEGNIPALKEFTCKEYASSVIVARNDNAFSGGTSKTVTVVSRADVDELQKALTADLIEKAKAELSQTVSGKEMMIDQTIKTTVKEKTFTEEVDQEASNLHGTLTVSVSAVTLNQESIITLLSGDVAAQVPSGYTMDASKTTVRTGTVQVAKDGKITAKVTVDAYALPILDTTELKKSIAGKTLTDAESVLRGLTGVARADFVFQKAWKKDRIPSKAENISITTMASE